MTAAPADLDRLWQDLLTQAVLGSDRAAPAVLPPADSAIHVLLKNLPSAAGTESALLAASAALALYRCAGRLPAPVADPLPAPCPLDDRPECSPAAAHRLAALLAGERPELLPEWLALAAHCEVRLPAALLPAALDLAAQRPELIDSLLPILGQRGIWLAAHNPQWEFAAPANPETVWQTSSRPQRLRLLRRLRREWPEEALRLLAASWSQEHADERRTCLAVLEINLSLADEPFLEAALDDRSILVRQAAAGLLWRLPASRLLARMLPRADACLAYEPGRWPLQRARLVVRLPEVCDAALQRDGIDPKPRAGAGDRAWWLAQIISAVPPAHWTRRWNVPPSEVLLRLADSEWEALLLDALCKAAARHPDPAWISALLDVDGERPELLEALPPVEAEACLQRALLRRKNGGGLWMAAHYRRPWSLTLTEAVIEYLNRHCASLATPAADGSTVRSIEGLSVWMDPHALPYAERWLRTEAAAGSPLEKSFAALLDTLAFRLAMHKELS